MVVLGREGVDVVIVSALGASSDDDVEEFGTLGGGDGGICCG